MTTTLFGFFLGDLPKFQFQRESFDLSLFSTTDDDVVFCMERGDETNLWLGTEIRGVNASEDETDRRTPIRERHIILGIVSFIVCIQFKPI